MIIIILVEIKQEQYMTKMKDKKPCKRHRTKRFADYGGKSNQDGPRTNKRSPYA